MISKDFMINNKLGLHARPSAQLTQIAGRYESEVFIARNGRRVNAKSIMGVMMLAAGPGSTVTVDAEGPDEQQAIDAIGILIESGFGEGLADVRPEPPHFGVAVVDALERRAASDVVVDLHVRREGFERAGVIAGVPFVKRTDNHVDVLLRHRPPSIPVARGSGSGVESRSGGKPESIQGGTRCAVWVE